MSRKVAFCWELGGGFGHFSPLEPLVDFFQREGFEISFIARDVWSAGRWFDQDRFMLFQAPLRHGAGLQFTSTPTFAHILHNVGYGDPAGLSALAGSWKSLFELIRPDLILADHSPTAVLAVLSLTLVAVLAGNCRIVAAFLDVCSRENLAKPLLPVRTVPGSLYPAQMHFCHTPPRTGGR